VSDEALREIARELRDDVQVLKSTGHFDLAHTIEIRADELEAALAEQPRTEPQGALPCGHDRKFWLDIGETQSASGIKLPETWLCVMCQLAAQPGRAAVLEWLENEDIENDPDDLYTGRRHRVAAIRNLATVPQAAQKENKS
jgi:hypothetical protein